MMPTKNTSVPIQEKSLVSPPIRAPSFPSPGFERRLPAGGAQCPTLATQEAHTRLRWSRSAARRAKTGRCDGGGEGHTGRSVEVHDSFPVEFIDMGRYGVMDIVVEIWQKGIGGGFHHLVLLRVISMFPMSPDMGKSSCVFFRSSWSRSRAHYV